MEIKEQPVEMEEVEKQEATVEEPLAQAETQPEEQGSFSIFGDEFGAEEPKKKKSVRNV